ncbi:MAG TPA: rod shape-determining protein [Anaerolineaceae bacterium]|jgi:rod shape-determining protein MreB|nr:rod shape-determining protein [Anaerolineaceae bacterium]
MGLSRELGIDLGTFNTQIAEGNQILIQEPTVVAIVVDEMKLVEYGTTALGMMGRVPESIEVVRPLRNGVIAEYELIEIFLREMIRKVTGPTLFFRPRLILSIPYGVTSVERRAVQEAGLGAGAREVSLVPQPLAAAIGIDLPINTPTGNMIISLGAGTTQAAVVSMSGIVSAETSRTAGLRIDDAIINYVRKKYGLIIGQTTAEQLKLNVGAAIPTEDEKTMEIQGQDQVSGLPKPASLTTNEIVDAIQPPLEEIVATIRRVLEKTPPELISDIIDRGVALCGGTSLMKGLDKYLTVALGIPAYVVENPVTCTVEGLAKAFPMLEVIQRSQSR